MIHKSLLFLTVLQIVSMSPAAYHESQDSIQQIDDNLVIKSSVTFKAGEYRVPDQDGNGVIQIAADNITVDLSGVILWGGEKDKVNTFTGIGISLNGHKNVTIKNGNIHGFKYNIFVKNAEGVKIVGTDTSYPLGPVINDNGEIKDIWLGLRDLGAWRSYGSGMWLEDCKEMLVQGCRGHGGANGLLTVNTTKSKIYSNDFSFNSSWGIGLWASTENEVFWNLIDFVGRPWSGTVGADSAALVVVNKSDKNWFIGNSMTHSGDGFFLTNKSDVGNYTDGQCNDNVIAFNDGSYAPANAFEGTFSERNIYARNLANHSGYGFWLGYSSNNVILENQINNNGESVAIECAEGSIIVGNEMKNSRGAAVNLWSNNERRPSRNSLVTNNTITDCGSSLGGKTSKITFKDNTIKNSSPPKNTDLNSSDLKFSLSEFWDGAVGKRLKVLEKEVKKNITFYSENPRMPNGLMWYKFDRWAPHDFRKDVCAFAKDNTGTVHFWIMRDNLVPDSKQKGFSVEKTNSPYHFTIKGSGDKESVGGIIKRELTLKGAQDTPITVQFEIEEVYWDVKYYTLTLSDIKDEKAWNKLFSSKPELTVITGSLSDRWKNERPHSGRWAFSATTKYKFEPGTYKFSTVSDDGVRVYVDDKLIINNWTHHHATTDSATITLDGTHTIKVLYFQNGGGSAFIINWSKSK